MRWHPKHYGGDRTDPEIFKRDGWRDQGILVVSASDQRLSWPERELIKQIGEKLYGNTKPKAKEHDGDLDSKRRG